MSKTKHKLKLKLKIKLKKIHLNLIWVALTFLFIPLTTFLVLYFGKIYPGITVAGMNLSGKSPEEAIKILSNIKPPDKIVLTTSIDSGKNSFEIPSDSIGLGYDYNKTADIAYKFGRSGNPIYDASEIISSLIREKTLGLNLNMNEESLANNIFTVAGQVGTDPINPSAKLTNGVLVVDNGKKGTVLDSNSLRLAIGVNLAKAKSDPIEIPVMEVDPTLNTFQLAAFTKRAQTLSAKSLSLNFEDRKLEYSGNDILSLLNPNGGYNSDKVQVLSQNVAALVNRPSQEAKFVFDQNRKRVDTFQPSKDGVSVSQGDLTTKIIESLTDLESSQDNQVAVDVPAQLTKPTVQTGDINNLGIKELIGKGTSIFKGSIASRVFNVDLAASRVSGTLVAPGETFSFNNAVGDISALSGYQKAYIIQDGKTILGDGGGVCQVSTTLFRAVLDAGLPVVDRSAHAYRVFYYEEDAPPGLDATVYSPTVDFKFKNDTANYILVQAISNPKNYSLTFELYGTKDGRVSEIGKPVITSTTPPPPDVYQDDPTLPAGTTKQTEHRALGTNLYMTYKVTRNGETLFQKTFYSRYLPWGNVFLRGTGV